MAEDRFSRALVVAADAPLRRSMARVLDRWATEVVQAGDSTATERHLRLNPDLVLLDLAVAPHALNLVRALLDSQPMCAVVVIGGASSASDAFRLGRLGVLGYLDRPFSLKQLDEALEEAIEEYGLRRRSHPASAPSGGTIQTALKRCATDYVRAHGLSPRETEIVQLTLDGVGRGDFPHLLGISENTCKTTIRRMLRKCGASRLAEIPSQILIAAQEHRG